MSLNYNHLRYFWAVAHEGNLTRAAERMNVSQSALSVQIQKLEARLGQALFDRRGKALHLTEAGRIALDHADRIFAAGEELQATLSQAGRIRQIIRVGALATLSRNFQMAFLGPVIGDDSVEVILRSGRLAELLDGLEAHRLDVVLLNQAPPRDGATPWIAREVDAQPVSLIGTPGRLAGRHDVAELIGAEPVVLPSFDSPIRAGFDALCARLGVVPRIAAELDDMAMLRLFARDDVGLAVVPPIVVRDELAAGALHEAAPLKGITETFVAVTLQRRFPNPVLARLLA